MKFIKTREKVCMTYTLEIDDVHGTIRIDHSKGLLNANDETRKTP